MTPAEKRFLSRRACSWCDQPLDRDWCGATMWTRCTPEQMAERRHKCLETYKPRRPKKS